MQAKVLVSGPVFKIRREKGSYRAVTKLIGECRWRIESPGDMESMLETWQRISYAEQTKSEALLVDTEALFEPSLGQLKWPWIALFGTVLSKGLSACSLDEALRFIVQHQKIFEEGAEKIRIPILEDEDCCFDGHAWQLVVWRKHRDFHIDVEDVDMMDSSPRDIGRRHLFIRSRSK